MERKPLPHSNFFLKKHKAKVQLKKNPTSSQNSEVHGFIKKATLYSRRKPCNKSLCQLVSHVISSYVPTYSG